MLFPTSYTLDPDQRTPNECGSGSTSLKNTLLSSVSDLDPGYFQAMDPDPEGGRGVKKRLNLAYTSKMLSKVNF